MQQTDLSSFLPGNLLAYSDAMSMQHALELRSPFLDHRMIETVETISAGTRFAAGPKSILKHIAARFLPGSVLDRSKRGFNPPIGAWLKADLRSLVHDRLTPSSMNLFGIEWALSLIHI